MAREPPATGRGFSRFSRLTRVSTPFVHRLRVRYVECDMQAIVFNSHYYTWMDIAHAELIREVLGPIEELRRLGVDVVVAESSARYRGSARYDQDIDIEVRLEALTTSSMTTTYAIRHGQHLLVEGRVRHVGVDPVELTKKPWPDEVRAAFTPLL
jgi:acyl-CoA thioester hydrolase